VDVANGIGNRRLCHITHALLLAVNCRLHAGSPSLFLDLCASFSSVCEVEIAVEAMCIDLAVSLCAVLLIMAGLRRSFAREEQELHLRFHSSLSLFSKLSLS
jgi:hypothetical protein